MKPLYIISIILMVHLRLAKLEGYVFGRILYGNSAAHHGAINLIGENLTFEENQNMYQQRSPPVKEGEVYEVKIESLGREGDGIAKVENFVVIVPNTQVDDTVQIRITKVSRRVAFGDVIETSEVLE